MDVHFPAVVEAAQTTLLVTTIDQRRATVRTVFVHHAHLALAVAKHHKIFTEDTCFHGCAICFGHFFDQAHRRPVSAHELAHGGVAFHAAQQFVLFFGQHGYLLAVLRVPTAHRLWLLVKMLVN